MTEDIRYQFRYVYGITQERLAEEVERRCAEDGSGYACETSFISTLLGKIARGGHPKNGKEMVAYNHLLDILEELKRGKTWS